MTELYRTFLCGSSYINFAKDNIFQSRRGNVPFDMQNNCVTVTHNLSS